MKKNIFLLLAVGVFFFSVHAVLADSASLTGNLPLQIGLGATNTNSTITVTNNGTAPLTSTAWTEVATGPGTGTCDADPDPNGVDTAVALTNNDYQATCTIKVSLTANDFALIHTGAFTTPAAIPYSITNVTKVSTDNGVMSATLATTTVTYNGEPLSALGIPVGGTGTFAINPLTAPSTPGSYPETWTLSDSLGQVPNGVYTQTIQVSSSTAPVDTASASSTASSSVDVNITAPANLVPIEETSSTISLAWTASTEASGTIAGYDIYRNGAQVGTSVDPSFIDTGLSPSTAYFYTVAAYDTGDNISPQSTKEAGTTSYFSTLNNISSTFASNLSEGISSYFFPAPPTVSISANPTTITQGQTATITWTSTNASACTASDSLGNGSIGLSGSLSESPADAGTYTYTIECSGSDGSTDPESSTVVVSGAPAAAATSSTSTTVASGTSTSTASLIAELQLLRIQLLKLLIAELQVLLRQAQAQGVALPAGAAAYL